MSDDNHQEINLEDFFVVSKNGVIETQDCCLQNESGILLHKSTLSGILLRTCDERPVDVFFSRKFSNSSTVEGFDILDVDDFNGMDVPPETQREILNAYCNHEHNSSTTSACEPDLMEKFKLKFKLSSREDSCEDSFHLVNAGHVPESPTSSTSSTTLKSITESLSEIPLTPVSSASAGSSPSEPLSHSSSPSSSLKILFETSSKVTDHSYAVQGDDCNGLGNVEDTHSVSIREKAQQESVCGGVETDWAGMRFNVDVGNVRDIMKKTDAVGLSGAMGSLSSTTSIPSYTTAIGTPEGDTESKGIKFSDIRGNWLAIGSNEDQKISSDSTEKDGMDVDHLTFDPKNMSNTETKSVHLSLAKCDIRMQGIRSRPKSDPGPNPVYIKKKNLPGEVSRALSEPKKSDLVNLDLLIEIRHEWCTQSDDTFFTDTGTGSVIKHPTEQSIRQCIKDNCNDFVNYSNWKLLLPHLQSKDLLDSHTTEKLMNKYTTNRDKGLEFYLSVLPTKGGTAYSRLYECIALENEHSGHRTLLELMNKFDQ